MLMTVTAYSPDHRSCGDSADGITASGYSVWTNGMKMAAADTDLLPFGSLISVPGYDHGNVVPVLDRGAAIKGRRLDVLFPTHQQAVNFGIRMLEITVWEYADGEPSDYQPRYHRAASVNG
jgi:3D (Asp-Asp-Asp) domain-containing protein